MTLLETEPPGRPLAMAYSNRSQLHMLAGEREAAVSWGERARTLAVRLGDVETSLHAEINVSTARLGGGDAAAAAALREAHERAAALGLADHAARALVNLATTLVQLAEYEVARDPTGVTEGDVAVLRGHGLADADILQIVLAVCLRRFFSGVLSAVGAVPDPVFDGLPADVRAAFGGTAETF